MEAESTNRQLQSQCSSLLDRAKSFNHLMFYNRKLINIYLIASRGFKLFLSRNGHQQAKCVQCGNSFKLDPIIDEQTIQPKQNFNFVINHHEQSCKFSSTTKKEARSYSDLVNKLCNFGAIHFWQILQSNSNKKQSLNKYTSIKDCLSQTLDKNLYLLVKKLVGRQENEINAYMISLLGWKITSNKMLSCQYCAQEIQDESNFHITESHRKFCFLVFQNKWKTILQKLVIAKLQPLEGQFEKSEGEAYAKKLRKQLQMMIDEPIGKVKEVKLKIKSIKNSIQSVDQQQSVQKQQRCRKLNKIDNYLVQIEQFLKNSIKRIKIQ